ncbi:MAG: guanylate kinase [Desulfobulbaceae bacterium]|nr:MAG: guanylate kinase [Desulfobulbaceae bacterium]
MTAGRLFVISAPSGTGKTTILKKVMARLSGLVFSVSHTTRAPRPGERDGREYHFVSHADFEAMLDGNQFLEWASVHDNYYGTSRQAVAEELQRGLDVILDIDVQGAAIIRKSSGIEATHIFISPPGLVELEHRLRGRGTESEESIQLRLKNARIEMQAADDYEYLIVNDVLDEAVDLLSAIILAERARAHRLPDGSPIQLIGI